MLVAHDFDGTLTVENVRVDNDGREHRTFRSFNWRQINALRNHARRGDTNIIVTARKGIHADKALTDEGYEQYDGYPLVHFTLHRFRLPVEAVVFTNGALKGPVLRQLGVNVLYDDLAEQRASAMEHGVEARLPK